MGDLRSTKYPLLALKDMDADIRRRAVACLAMLGDPSALAPLASRAENDVDAGVREMALFAIGMLDAKGTDDILRERAKHEVVDTVRQIAKRALRAGEGWAWRL